MSKSTKRTPLAVAVGAALTATLAAAPVVADANPFGLTELSGGYMLAAQAAAAPQPKDADKGDAKKDAEGKCGAKKDAEGKCGAKKDAEGKCGAKKDAEGKCGAEGNCGEGGCGANHDADAEEDADKGAEGKCGGTA